MHTQRGINRYDVRDTDAFGRVPGRGTIIIVIIQKMIIMIIVLMMVIIVIIVVVVVVSLFRGGGTQDSRFEASGFRQM